MDNYARRGSKDFVEVIAKVIFTVCAFMAVLAVASITIYMVMSGMPAIFEVGLGEILFSSTWAPTAANPQYGILYVVLTSIVGTTFSILIGVPVGGTGEVGCHSKTGSGAFGGNSFCSVRTFGDISFESLDV